MSYQACPQPQCKSQVNDANFVVRQDNGNGAVAEQLIGRKQLFRPDGTPFELYDLEMDKIGLHRANYFSLKWVARWIERVSFLVRPGR